MVRNLISVVDDDESVRGTTKLLIESFGFRAAAFESAEKFLSSGKLESTSRLIVEVRMSGMNGLQLQSQLAAAGCRIPIICIAAYDSKESRRRAMQGDAVAFLRKPFTDEQLLQAIRSALRDGKARGRREFMDSFVWMTFTFEAMSKPPGGLLWKMSAELRRSKRSARRPNLKKS